MSIFMLPGSEHGVRRELFLSARMLPSLHQFVPDVYSVTLFLPTSSNTAYTLSGIGRFDKILPCPHKDPWAGTAFVLGKYKISVA